MSSFDQLGADAQFLCSCDVNSHAFKTALMCCSGRPSRANGAVVLSAGIEFYDLGLTIVFSWSDCIPDRIS
jgi:hypothetical protein